MHPEPSKHYEEFDPQEDVWDEHYGEEPMAEDISQDLDDAEDQLEFARRVDMDGMNLLHYFGVRDARNECNSVPLVRRLLEIDPQLAQAVDSHGDLPLRYYGSQWAESSDYLEYVRQRIREEPPMVENEVKYLLPTFPEAIFATDLLGVLSLNRAYKTSNILSVLNNNDEGEQGEDELEKKDFKSLLGFLKFSFADGLHRVPTPESVLGTGKRAPFHILCSYAYEPVFESLFDVFFTPSMASLPDMAVHGILPLHLILRSPTLCHPLNGGPIYGFFQMKQLGKSIHIPTVKKLIDAYPEAVAIADENGCLPLHLAVRHNNADLLKYLVEANPESVTALDHLGRSPLRIACQQCCDLDVIYFLVGANPTPTHWLRGLRAKEEEEDAIAPPRIAAIPNQSTKNFTGTSELEWTHIPNRRTRNCNGITAALASGSAQSVRWCMETFDPKEARWCPCDASYRGIEIHPVSGRIRLECHHPWVIRVRVTAENPAGWSSTEFQIDLAGPEENSKRVL